MDLRLAKRLLGIEWRVSENKLKSIYRQKALELHPDVNKSPTASEDFRNLNIAYQFLLKNRKELKQKPKGKPKCPMIYRILSGKDEVGVSIPNNALNEDDLCIQFVWRGQEYRTVLKKGTQLPKKIKMKDIPLILSLVEEPFTY